VLNLVARFQADLKPKKIILFGSRARGDFRPNSDFDLCLVDALVDPTIRAKARITSEEEPLTLHKIDLVFYDEVSEEFRRNIDREGIAIYGE
jgi:predicted nucleotidyltransferase